MFLNKKYTFYKAFYFLQQAEKNGFGFSFKNPNIFLKKRQLELV